MKGRCSKKKGGHINSLDVSTVKLSSFGQAGSPALGTEKRGEGFRSVPRGDRSHAKSDFGVSVGAGKRSKQKGRRIGK